MGQCSWLYPIIYIGLFKFQIKLQFYELLTFMKFSYWIIEITNEFPNWNQCGNGLGMLLIVGPSAIHRAQPNRPFFFFLFFLFFFNTIKSSYITSRVISQSSHFFGRQTNPLISGIQFYILNFSSYESPTKIPLSSLSLLSPKISLIFF